MEVFFLIEGQVLALFRKFNGYDSCSQLSKRCDICATTIRRIESGKFTISKSILQQLADIYNIRYIDLLISFKLLKDLDFDNPNERKTAYCKIAALSVKSSNSKNK